MTVFWVVAGCLIGAALLFIILPLFRREVDVTQVERRAVNISIYKNQLAELETELAAGELSQEQYDKSRQEIERRLLEDAAVAEHSTGKSGHRLNMATAGVAVLTVPVFVVMMYLDLGNLDALNPEVVVVESEPTHGDKADMTDQIEMMIGKLAERLQQSPDDAEGWVMLGRSYSALRRYQEAVKAFEKAVPLAGENAAILADYADAMAMATDKNLNGKPMQLLEKALSIDPDNKKALWLAGTGLFELGDFAGAINYWQRLSDTLSPGSEDKQVMENNIAEARSYRKRQLAGEFGTVPATSQASQEIASAQATVKAKITGTVSLSPDLQDKISPSDTLFVFARAVSGRPVPLAIIRARASDLPMQFTLDESQAMTPTTSLANFDQVVVGARISRSDEALPQSGDLQGLVQAVTVGSDGLEIIIDSVVP